MKCFCQQGPPMMLCALHAHELRRRMSDFGKTIEAQRALLREALEALEWCSGADDFQPSVVHRDAIGPVATRAAGKARAGWLRGPAVVIEQLKKVL